MSFLIKPYTGHVGVCVLNRTGIGASNTWTLQGGTFTPTINTSNDTVTLQGGFRYFIQWNWALNDSVVSFNTKNLQAILSTTSAIVRSKAVANKANSTFATTQLLEATITFDSPCDSTISQIATAYESQSSSLIIWRFPL